MLCCTAKISSPSSRAERSNPAISSAKASGGSRSTPAPGPREKDQNQKDDKKAASLPSDTRGVQDLAAGVGPDSGKASGRDNARGEKEKEKEKEKQGDEYGAASGSDAQAEDGAAEASTGEQRVGGWEGRRVGGRVEVDRVCESVP